MSAPSDNMPAGGAGIRVRRRCCCVICRISSAPPILVALAATMPFDGYILNILMQAATFAIAVFGLSVVLGLCGQINLAQAAFFGFGAYAVGIGTADYQLSFWLCLLARLRASRCGRRAARRLDAAARRPLPRHGDDLVPADRHAGHDQLDPAHPRARTASRASAGPTCSSRRNRYLAFCVGVLALVGYLVWHLPDTRLGRAMRAVRDNELAAGVAGIDVFRTKVCAFALSARARRARPAGCSPAASPMSARTSSPSRSRSCS